MSEPPRLRLGRRPTREPKLPSERDWERAVVLEPRHAPHFPELVSDGGGLPFRPAALTEPSPSLSPDDHAVAALLDHLTTLAGPKHGARARWKRSAPARPAAIPSLDGWRLLARTNDEALFGRGVPPTLLTVAVRKNARRRTWTYSGSSRARPLRATRDGIRASSWRLDPTHGAHHDEAILRVLVTEQTFASGQRADGRVLVPDIYSDGDRIVLTVFVTPRAGFQTGARNPETPVHITLPQPVGGRELIDGALAPFPAA